MSQARRTAVSAAFDVALGAANTRAVHPGLLLDRGLSQSDAEQSAADREQRETPKTRLLRRVAQMTASPLYGAAYRRWRDLLTARPLVAWARVKADGALIVGLGGEGVLETAITLQRSYGMPVIPGSALKGLTRRYAQQVLAKEGAAEGQNYAYLRHEKNELQGAYHEVLFGSQKAASYLTYYDAWYVAEESTAHPFLLDVITVHHPKYYTQAQGRPAPWDFDDPTPVSFVSAQGEYLLAVEGPDASWSRAALSILIRAVRDYGVGGKTSSGYGRLSLVQEVGATEHDSSPLPGRQDDKAGQEPTDPLSAAVLALPQGKVRAEINGHVQRWHTLTDEQVRVRVGKAIMQKVAELNDSKWVASRPYLTEVQVYLAGHTNLQED